MSIVTSDVEDNFYSTTSFKEDYCLIFQVRRPVDEKLFIYSNYC
jgi:hypothetical protein